MPEWRDEIRRRLAGTRLRPEREAEIVDEIAQHLDDRYRDRLAAGLGSEHATAAAWRELEEHGVLAMHIARVEPPPRPLPPIGAPARGAWFVAVWQDLRYALRRLRSQPFFTLTAVVTLALSIGPATAAMGVADYLFFRPVPGVSAPDRLFSVQFGRKSERGLTVGRISYANATDLTAGATQIAGITGANTLTAGFSVPGNEPRREQGGYVQFNYFDLLGVSMAAGRGFLAEEDASPGGVASVVLSYALASQAFGSAPSALERVVLINSEPFAVVGVTEPTFGGLEGPTRFWITGQAYKRAAHFAPAQWPYEVDRGPFYQFIVRAARGASVDAAYAELRARARALADTGREGNDKFKTNAPEIQPGLRAPRSLNERAVTVVRFLAAVAVVLVLIGIANVANLLIFRGLKAGRDVAVRKALGASTARLLQLTLVECLLLALAGSAAGIGIALGIREFLSDLDFWRTGPLTIPLDWRVLGGTVALAGATAIGFGVGPALLAARSSLLGGLGRGIRHSSPRGALVRQWLATAQLALSLALLVGAALFLTTLRNLRAVDLGVDPSGVTMMSVQLRNHGYDTPRALAYHEQVLRRLEHAPGIEGVAITYGAPILGGNFFSRIYLPGQNPKTDAVEVMMNGVTSNFFDVFKMKLIKGRRFTQAEDFASSTSPAPVILTAAAARQLFGDTDPIGRTVLFGPTEEFTVIGVTADVRWQSITRAPDVVAYQPWGRFDLNNSQAIIAVRQSGTGTDVAQRVRQAAAAIDPAVPLNPETAMSALIDRSIAQQRLFARVLSLLGIFGFALAAVGLHGLVSQMVTERSREFGIRMAIGADRMRVFALIARQATIVAGGGVAMGIALALATGRFVESQLFGVSSRAPLVYLGSAGLLVIVVALALVGPVRTALRVNPITVLRTE